MAKTDLPYITASHTCLVLLVTCDLRPAGDPSPAIVDFKNSAGDICDDMVLCDDAPRDSLRYELKIRLYTKILMKL